MKLIFLSLIIAAAADAFSFFEPETSNKPTGYWDDQDFSRNEDSSCECGKWFEGIRRWKAFVVLSVSNTSNVICTGTIITSNLVVTSHKCLQLERTKPMNVYDLWKPKGGAINMAQHAQVHISVGNTTEKIPVEDIIYEAHYAITSATESFPERDMVLLKVSKDFLASDHTVPICIPPHSFQENLTDQLAEYYSVDGSGDLNENFQLGLVRPLQVCNIDSNYNETEEGGNNDQAAICFQYSGIFGKELGGGPLIVNSSTDTAFLFGTAEAFYSRLDRNYVYFTNVTSMVKYIEYQAERAGSRWCTTPAFGLDKPITFDKSRSWPHPWELMRSPGKRKETLNCVCGILNTEQSGRVVGGVTATPYEFGWQVLLRPYMRGRHQSSFLCGGSIINDRIILTAAHCVVSKEKIRNGEEKPGLTPEEFDVFINVHERMHDPKAISRTLAQVFYHPDFVPAQEKGYFDYDIAILVLTEPMNFAEGEKQGIRPVCIPDASSEYIDLTGKTATVIGWGLTNPNEHSSIANKLQKLDIPIADLALCSRTATTRVTDRNLCAGTLNKWKDAAAGDSGGPLMIKNARGQYEEVGIVSWGEDVHTREGEKTAALYSDVQRLLNFIDYYSKVLDANWCKPLA